MCGAMRYKRFFVGQNTKIQIMQQNNSKLCTIFCSLFIAITSVQSCPGKWIQVRSLLLSEANQYIDYLNFDISYLVNKDIIEGMEQKKPKQTICIPEGRFNVFTALGHMMASGQRWVDNQCCRCVLPCPDSETPIIPQLAATVLILPIRGNFLSAFLADLSHGAWSHRPDDKYLHDENIVLTVNRSVVTVH